MLISASNARRPAAQAGATLIELLVAIGFVATLGLVTLPSLDRLLRSSDVRDAASSIAQGFRKAQSLALANQENYILVAAPEMSVSPPQFCWDAAGQKKLYAIVRDVEGDCKIGATDGDIDDCSSEDVELVSWGPVLPQTTTFIRVPATGNPYDIGGAEGTDRAKTLCFTPRGLVSRTTALGTGVYVGNDYKGIYRKVQVGLSGRAKVLLYKNGDYE